MRWAGRKVSGEASDVEGAGAMFISSFLIGDGGEDIARLRIEGFAGGTDSELQRVARNAFHIGPKQPAETGGNGAG